MQSQPPVNPESMEQERNCKAAKSNWAWKLENGAGRGEYTSSDHEVEDEEDDWDAAYLAPVRRDEFVFDAWKFCVSLGLKEGERQA